MYQYAPQAPQANVYGVPAPATKTCTGFGVTALVTGILGILFAWVPGFGLVLAAVGTVFGGIAVARTRRASVPGKGMAIAGLVMGIVGVVLFALIVIVVAINS